MCKKDISLTAGIVLFTLFTFASCAGQGRQVAGEGDFPVEMVGFTAYPANPVFAGTGGDTWDKKIRERGFILYEEGLYKMWYTGYNADMAEEKFLGYATSDDGVNWVRYSDTPVFNAKWTEDVFVLKHEGLYYMYAEGADDIAHLLTSADGINWREQGDLTITTTRGDTIPAPFGTPALWIEDGKWYLFYERNDAAVWLATSEDKLHWTHVQDEPVLSPGPETYDKGAIAVNQVVKHKGKYYLYYHATPQPYGGDVPNTWNVDVAVSDDLIHWRKYPDNPLVENDCSSPILVFDGEKPGLYTMHPAVCRYSIK
jgi:sucrose-6-phosphate hydrolase SacC (GH32 family)